MNKKIDFKEKVKSFKVQTIKKIKRRLFKEISVLKVPNITHYHSDLFSRKVSTEEFYQEKRHFMNEKLRNKYNLVVSYFNHLSKHFIIHTLKHLSIIIRNVKK